jgi:hypothetical protein
MRSGNQSDSTMKLPLLLLTLSAAFAVAEVSTTIAHQGRLVADGLNYTGTAYFKFRIYQADAGPIEPAIGQAVLTSGRVTAITLLHGGSGYTSAPSVTIEAPGGVFPQQATARANISAGAVTSFTMLAQGSGYTRVPEVVVALAPGASNLWSNSVDLLPGRDQNDPPPSGVGLAVSGGLYQVALGNTALTNMRALAADIVPDPGKSAWLRVWVGTNRDGPYQELFPHQPVTPVAYARHAATATSAETIVASGPSTAGLLVTGGALGAGAIPAEGEGSRLMWYSAERAFRAGSVDATLVDPQGDGGAAGRWDAVNVGRYSTAMGNNTVASGIGSTAFGGATTADGNYSLAVGLLSSAPQHYSAALGLDLLTSNLAQTAVGKWNSSNANALFVVGNGTSNASRSNAFSVHENGDAITGGNATILGNIVQTGNLTTAGNAAIYGDASVAGTADFDDDVYMDQALEVNGTFRVTATASITGTTTIGGNANISGSATVTGNVSAQNLNLSQNFTAAGDGSVKTLTITGGADIAEPFDLGGENLEPGTVLVIDEDHTGRLCESSEGYDRRVAGVISGAGGINPGLSLSQPGVNAGGHPVALAGRVYVKATGPIRPGDLLTTSEVPGHAMRAGDAARTHGAVLGKAMSSLKSGRGLVLVLVSLQ